MQRLGGANLYVQVSRIVQREKLAQEIAAHFNGRNIIDLARRFGVSVRQVQRVLSSQRQDEQGDSSPNITV